MTRVRLPSITCKPIQRYGLPETPLVGKRIRLHRLSAVHFCLAAGLTESQRQQIMRSLAYAAYGAENFVAAFRRLAGVGSQLALIQS